MHMELIPAAPMAEVEVEQEEEEVEEQVATRK